jgi:hypothetical protein
MEKRSHGIMLDREHGRLSILYRHGILPKNKISPPSAKASSSTRCSGLSVLEHREIPRLDAAIARSAPS